MKTILWIVVDEQKYDLADAATNQHSASYFSLDLLAQSLLSIIQNVLMMIMILIWWSWCEYVGERQAVIAVSKKRRVAESWAGDKLGTDRWLRCLETHELEEPSSHIKIIKHTKKRRVKPVKMCQCKNWHQQWPTWRMTLIFIWHPSTTEDVADIDKILLIK